MMATLQVGLISVCFPIIESFKTVECLIRAGKVQQRRQGSSSTGGVRSSHLKSREMLLVQSRASLMWDNKQQNCHCRPGERFFPTSKSFDNGPDLEISLHIPRPGRLECSTSDTTRCMRHVGSSN